MSALRTLALADAGISALVGTRVYVNEIPKPVIEAQDPRHPAKMLVLRQAGGFGNADLLPIDESVVTALCYGEDQQQADAVRRSVWDRFRYLVRETFDNVCFHRLNPTGGPIPLVDPDIVWKAVAQDYAVLADVAEE